MLRRDPTMIPMKDSDIQDIRDMVAKQKQDLQTHQQLIVKMKRLAESSTMSKEDDKMLEQMKDVVIRTDKAKRLGLEPGTTISSCYQRFLNV